MRTLTNSAIVRSREKATNWLLSLQREDGCLEANFGFNHGPAESWSTALFVNLPGVPDKEKERAREFLRQRATEHPAYGKGWGYNSKTTPDADTTFETMRALGLLPDRDKTLALRNIGGGFATYTEADANLIHPGWSVVGWTSSHLEITANVLHMARLAAKSDPKWDEVVGRVSEDLVDYVRRHGYRAYWYHSPVVAAATVLRALGSFRADLPPIPLPKEPLKLSWEVQNNPHIMGCAIEAALLYDPIEYREVIAYLVERLVRAQRPNGSWRSTLVVSVPYPDETDPRWVAHINADYGMPTVTVMQVISALNKLTI